MRKYLSAFLFIALACTGFSGSAQTADSLYMIEEPVKEEQKSIFYITETLPVFPGGNEALQAFIMKNTRYPKDAIKRNIQGKVIIGFVIDKEGFIRDAEILSGLCPSIDAEALRIVNIMPKWKPGTQGGKNVDVIYRFPISFQLQ